MPKFETTLTHVDDTTTITTDDPEVHATVANIESARLIEDTGDRKRFELARRDARIHFPHLLDNS